MAAEKQIVITSKVYVDGQLKAETVKVVDNKPGLLFYLLPILSAILIFSQIIIRT